MSAIVLGIFGYIIAQLVVGLLVSRRIANEEDYLLAGRSFGYGLATFSFFATWFGAETCIGSAAAIYEKGLSGASSDPFGYGACLIFMGIAFAIPLWRRGLTTLADLFRQRFSPGVERFAVLMMAPTSVLWAAAQIRGFGHVLGASSELSPAVGISVAAAVAIIYTAFGGMRADVMTDFIQGIMIIIGLLAIFFVLFFDDNAPQAAWSSIDPARLKLFSSTAGAFKTLEAWSIPIFGSVVAQELVSRVLACRSPGVAQRSALMGAALYICIGLIPVWLGLIGLNMFPGLDDPEQIISLIARKHLSPFLYVLFAGALVSAILSTVDSTLLAAASLVSHNLIIPLKRGMDEAAKVRTSRRCVVAFGVIAWLLALTAESIFDLVESASSFGSSGIFIIMTFGLFSRIGNSLSAYLALITGMAVWAWGHYVGKWTAPYLASLAAALAVYFVSAMVIRVRTPIPLTTDSHRL
jgi:SSS family solute:Na+ symporter